MGRSAKRYKNDNINRKKLFLINQKKRRRLTIFMTISITISSILISQKIIMYNNCKEISSAVEYLMTKNVDNALLRVQTIELKFSDGETAVVEAFGLSKEKPHQSTNVECHLRKKNNLWKLENSYILR